MKTNKAYIPETLKKLWEIKNEIYNETKNLSIKEVLKYFHDGTQKACKEMGVKLVKNPDGKSSRMVKI